jgi:hypothetical protein
MARDDLNAGLLMFVAYRAMEKRVLDAIMAAGYDDITLAQARVFQRIGPDGTRLAERGRAAGAVAAAVVAEVEAEWAAHLGARRMTQLRETLGLLREITDPYRAR